MKKLLKFLSVFLVLLLALAINSKIVKAEVACPVGYTCVPINQPTQTPPPIVDTSVSSCIKLYVNLSVGSTNSNDIKKLQNFLISNKYLSGIASGVFDKTTEDAVKKFQEKKGISPTGFVGPITRKEINESCTKVGDSPYISILYPNGTENYKFGKDYLVTWYSSLESKNIKVYLDYYGTTNSPVNKFVSPTVSSKVGLNSYTIPANATDVSGQYKVRVCSEGSAVLAPCDVSNSTFTIEPFNSTEVAGDIQLKVNTVGFAKNSESYQINLSFTGSSANKKVKKWKINLPCKSDKLTIMSIPGNSCGITEMSNNSGYGNVENKEYYFINKSGVNQTVEATLIAYDSNNVLLGKSIIPLVIPPITAYSASPSPSPSPISGTNSTVNSIYILPSYDDKAGIWDKFTSGVGNANRTSADWNWFLSLNVPTTHTDISSITITNDSSNEGWSTSVANVFGRAPYPLVVVDSNGKQLNTGYGQNISIPQGSSGTYSYKLYGQMETTKYNGGTLTIKFTDGSTVTAKVPPSKVTPITPITNNNSSTESKKPVISSVKSLAGEENVVYAGERFSIQGKNLLTYASGNTNIYLGGQKVSATQIGNELAWVIAPNLPSGTYYLYVSNENGSSDYVKLNLKSKVSPSTSVTSEGFKSAYPLAGYPGIKVTLQLNNPKNLSLKQDDFSFGQYGFTNFTNSNNEVVTFTVPWDAQPGSYDIVWFGNETHVIKFNVISLPNTSAAIEWYNQISR